MHDDRNFAVIELLIFDRGADFVIHTKFNEIIYAVDNWNITRHPC